VGLVGASPDDRAALSRAASRAGVAELLAYEQGLPDTRLAGLVAGARVVLQPVRSDATGLTAMEALAAGVPVVATSVGALPEVVGTAGILVEPGEATRLATAIAAAWADGDPYPGLLAAARERARTHRTWADVARETRAVWAEAARPAPLL
jgi:glycosyltransferase involved in cell wall biosynthesis